MALILEIAIGVAIGVFLALTAWRFRVALLVVGMTVTGLVLVVVCCLTLYHYGLPRNYDFLTWPVAIWIAALSAGGWLLGPAAYLLGEWFVDRGK
jgi:hypothetical protein